MGYLIDSIFTNYYIPPLLFAINKVRAQHIRTAIDGKQRLTAINRFVFGYFVGKALQDLNFFFFVRFMNNEIPYLHHETNQEKYYCKTVDEGD